MPNIDMTVPLRIVTPTCELRTTVYDDDSKKPITWIVPPVGSCAIDIVFALSGAIATDDWPGKELLGSRLIAKLSLSQARQLWAVWVPLTDGGDEFATFANEWRAALQESRSIFRAGTLDKSKPDTRMLVPIRSDDGQQAIVDLSIHPPAA